MSLDLGYEPGGVADVVATRRRRHRVVETWETTGSAGTRVRVDAHIPETVERIVVMAHGADNSREARYIEVSGKSFTRHGTAIVAMDAPGHGDRIDAAPLSVLPGFLPGVLEEWVRDHRLLLDIVEGRWPGVPVGFAGFSMGGLFGVPLMAVDRRIAAGAIVIAGSTRLSYPPRLDLTAEQREVLEATDPAVFAPAVGDRPVLLLCAEDDEIVPMSSVHALHDAFIGPKELVVLPGTHTEWRRAAEWFRTMDEFFKRSL